MESVKPVTVLTSRIARMVPTASLFVSVLAERAVRDTEGSNPRSGKLGPSEVDGFLSNDKTESET